MWDVMSCSLEDKYLCFREPCSIHVQAKRVKTETASPSNCQYHLSNSMTSYLYIPHGWEHISKPDWCWFIKTLLTNIILHCLMHAICCFVDYLNFKSQLNVSVSDIYGTHLFYSGGTQIAMPLNLNGNHMCFIIWGYQPIS